MSETTANDSLPIRGHRAARPALTHVALAAVLLVAAALRFWRLDQNGFDNEYYAAAVRSMMVSWHNFFYNSFDPAGFVSVDKPPVALWLQVLSVKAFGFHGLAVLVPQALEGVASVWLVYHLVGRRFGAAAGLLGALFLAVTPVNVAIDRSGNTDSCLVLVLLLAAWALIRAAEDGRRGRLLLAAALIGVGFNVKMLAAFVVLPTFAIAYLLGAPLSWRRRLADLTLAGLVLIVTSLTWVVAYDLTPPPRRPFAGSSRQNSMLELTVGHNAMGRFVRLTGTARAAPTEPSVEDLVRQPSAEGAAAAIDPAVLRAWSRLFVRTPIGALRLANGQLAAQAGWLFPLALLGLVAGAFRMRGGLPPSVSLIVWVGWAFTYAIVYSYAGGIFHFYYLSTMAPPLAALAAIGLVASWRWYWERGWRAASLPAALLLTAAWQGYVQWSGLDSPANITPAGFATALVAPPMEWRALQATLLGGTLLATLVLLLVLAVHPSRGTRWASTVAFASALAALLILPVSWALSSVLIRGVPVVPSADLARLSPDGISAEARARARARDSANTRRLIAFLQGNRQSERYLLATTSTRLAAPIIIETGLAVMAMGGFHGLDPIVTPEAVARIVETDQVRFVMVGDLSPISRRLGGEAASKPVTDWVRANGKLVDPSLWRSDTSRAGRASAGRMGGMQLYDLRPRAELVPVASSN